MKINNLQDWVESLQELNQFDDITYHAFLIAFCNHKKRNFKNILNLTK